jgi:hypothetical protein
LRTNFAGNVRNLAFPLLLKNRKDFKSVEKYCGSGFTSLDRSSTSTSGQETYSCPRDSRFFRAESQF